MVHDANEIENGSVLEADLCIVGAGPAGLAIAREFETNPNTKIIILESGGLESEPETQRLYDGDVVGDPYESPKQTRSRRFGGTACDWNTPVLGKPGAKYVPLDALDFKKREGVPYSGWPFERTTLDPFYVRAHSQCGLKSIDYSGKSWQTPDCQVLASSSTRLASHIYQLGVQNVFIDDMLSMLKRTAHIDCWLHANVLSIEMGADHNAVSHLLAGTLSGKRFQVRAKRFVLATGGIENARIMLASRSANPAGVGNQNDLVGRFYMDHPVIFGYEIVPHSPSYFANSGFYDLRSVRECQVLGRVTLSEETMERERLLNCSLVLYPRPFGYRSRGIEALRQIRISFRRKELSPRVLRHAINLGLGVGDVVGFAYREKTRERIPQSHFWSSMRTVGDRFSSFEPEFYIEQEPDPDNRVCLSDERDALGIPRSRIHWKWSAKGRESADRTMQIIDEELRRAQFGFVRKLESFRLKYGAHHHIGATRMHVNPREGVVDANCQVHGIQNLFVAGSSVFPTGGYANPTLTIIALSIRLADHIKSLAMIGS